MKHLQQRSILFLLFLTVLLIQFGKWQGQVNDGEATKSGANSIFLLAYVPLLFGTLYASGVIGYLRALIPVKAILTTFLIAIMSVGLLRGELSSSINNIASVALTYGIILGLVALSFSMPFRRPVDLIIVFITFIFLPLTAYIHVTKVGPMVFFPDRLQDNNLRLGGLLYYAHTAMILGIGALFSLKQLITYKSKTERLYYAIVFLTLNTFLLLTDCRSSWGGVLVSYLILTMAYLTRINRWRFAICIGLLAGGVYLAKDISKIKAAPEYNTSDDFLFRMAIWGFAIDGIIDRPLTGYGNNNYFARNQKAMRLDDRLTDPHSSTLSLALQSGLVVVVLFYCLYARMARHYIRFGIQLHKPMIAVAIYWLLVPFMWGMIYNGSPGFIQIFFPLTFFLSLMHPSHFIRTSHAPAPTFPPVNIHIPYAYSSPQSFNHNSLLQSGKFYPGHDRIGTGTDVRQY